MTLSIVADGVENPANLARISDAAGLLGASVTEDLQGTLIAVENTAGAASIYGRRPLRDTATLVLGNERRGISKRTLAQANEIIEIPTVSRIVTTLNVAAAAAVAGWYVLRGSSKQPRVAKPAARRPSLMIIGDDHVEIGSSLRSAAALGFRDVLLQDRNGGWFDGPHAIRREAYAAARRHKNAIRVHPARIAHAGRFSEVVAVVAHDCGTPIRRVNLARGARQLVIVGSNPAELEAVDAEVRVATLELNVGEAMPLRLIASIAIAEIARQVGARTRVTGEPPKRPPVFDATIVLQTDDEVVLIDESDLLAY